MKTILCCLLLLLLSDPAATQTRRRPPATPQSTTASRSSKKLVETIRTQDGREIHLYDDMTYDVTAAAEPPAPPTIDLSIRAGVITKGGDVKAVARTDFIIFKGDIKDILASVTDREGKALDIFGFYMADVYRSLDEGRAYKTALERLKPLIVGTFTTDFEGNAAVQIPRSNTDYWIYGSFSVGRSSCMWYLQFTPNKNGSFILDNKNASFCG